MFWKKKEIPDLEIEAQKSALESKISEYQSKISEFEKSRKEWEVERRKESAEFTIRLKELQDQKRQVTVKDISINKVTLTEAWLDGFRIGFDKGWESSKGDLEEIRVRIRTDAINETLKRLNNGNLL